MNQDAPVKEIVIGKSQNSDNICVSIILRFSDYILSYVLLVGCVFSSLFGVCWSFSHLVYSSEWNIVSKYQLLLPRIISDSIFFPPMYSCMSSMDGFLSRWTAHMCIICPTNERDWKWTDRTGSEWTEKKILHFARLLFCIFAAHSN